MGSQAAKPDDQQSLLDDTDEVNLIEKISVVIMGHHGVGKNTVGNALLKKKAFTFTDRSKTYYLKEEYTTNNRHIVVTRVPGWSADLSSQKNAHLWSVIKDSVQSFVDGPNVIMLVVGTNTKPAETTKEKLKEILGDSVAQHILTVSVDRQKIVVYHSDRKQTIINRCKYHFFVRCMCGKQNRNLIESIEDFIVYKQDIHFCALGKKEPNLELQHQELAKLVNKMECKITALSKCVDSSIYVIESKNAKIRELQRLLKEKEDMLRYKEEEIQILKSNKNKTANLSVQHKKTEQLEHVAKQEEHVMMKKFQRQIGDLKRQLEEKNREIDQLRKEKQELTSQKGNKRKSSTNKRKQKDTNSIELVQLAREDAEGVQFLKKNRNKLIERIVAIKPIADELLQFIEQHKYDMILQAPTEYEQKRQLFNITQKGGEKLQIEFYKCLLKHEKYLVEELKESS